MVKLRLFFILSLFLGFLTFPCYADISEKEADQWVNDKGRELISALSSQDIDQKYAVLDQMFNHDVDCAYIGRFVLGTYWRKMTPEQQEIYQGLFRRYVVSLYKSYPLDFDMKGVDFSILSTELNGRYADVLCRVSLPEKYQTETFKAVNIAFKLVKNDARIQIVDLKIGESSLLLTYRTRFMAMIKDADEEMDWFLEDFQLQTESNEKNLQQEF